MEEEKKKVSLTETAQELNEKRKEEELNKLVEVIMDPKVSVELNDIIHELHDVFPHHEHHDTKNKSRS